LAHTDIGNTAGTIRTRRGWLPYPIPPRPESDGDEDGCWSRERRTNRRHHGCAAITVTSVDSGCLICGDGALSPGLFREDSVVVVELHTTASTTVAIPTIRVVAADLAARADFDLDSIADLRMAVDDACAVLVRLAAPGAMLRCRLTVWPGRIEMAAEVNIDQVADPLPTGSFGWRLLECLADEASAASLPAEPGQRARRRITLSKNAATAQQP
jgi:serine/threonine-protein kinase RsbW